MLLSYKDVGSCISDLEDLADNILSAFANPPVVPPADFPEGYDNFTSGLSGNIVSIYSIIEVKLTFW